MATVSTTMMSALSQTTLLASLPANSARIPLAPHAKGFASATSRIHSGASASGISTPASSETGWATVPIAVPRPCSLRSISAMS